MPLPRPAVAALALVACLATHGAGSARAEAERDQATLHADIDVRRVTHAVGPGRPGGEAPMQAPSPSDDPAVETPTEPPTEPRGEPAPQPLAEQDANRRLGAPPADAPASDESRRAGRFELGWSDFPVQSAGTAAAALAIVVGLFLLLATFLKKAAPRSHRPLPGEVVSVLGRTPLSGKQVAHLLKVGSKLVLVSVTPEGVAPIAEVTDPDEVTRLLGLCEQESAHSASAAFRDVFDRLARDERDPSFPGADDALVDRQRLAAAYANTPGGRAHD